MPIVTISGRIGCPARAVGLEVARVLGADYVDYQILIEAARRSGAPVADLAQKDERVSRGRERIAKIMQRFIERSAAAGAAGDPFLGPTGVEVLMSRTFSEAAQPASDQTAQVNDQRYLEIITSVIKETGATGNAVIIGRGSNVILKDLSNALHVWLIAALPGRIQEIMRRERLSEHDAQKYVKTEEEGRAAYYKKFFKVEPNDPDYYHLFVNTNRFGVEKTAHVISNSARQVTQAVAVPA